MFYFHLLRTEAALLFLAEHVDEPWECVCTQPPSEVCESLQLTGCDLMLITGNPFENQTFHFLLL